MTIRDIQNFRFFYKTGVRKTWDKNRDENFIGSSVSSNGRTQFGFFDIYHGDKAEKEGIEGFLRGFLDMAQDSQAIYEFLQNAVDANSTTFEMYYNEEYFLAFNNGSQFNFEGIRSILNVGVSTKSQDSSNIGKFGIGFKLIHRLVGEKSGLEELKNLSGPILFSWGNSEQLKELQDFSQDDHIYFEKDYYKELNNGKFINSKNISWLFKILLTNFPCQPEETIKDLKYKEVANTFTKQEVAELAHWAKNKIKVDTSKHSLNSGALFFLRLGKGKGSKLSNKRVEDGIQFSLSILNNIAKFQGKQGISQIRVNENVFEAKRLFFERFLIRFGSDEYNQIKPQRRNEEDTSDIEVLVGFMDYKIALKEIKGNPNFYLFFPLSEEVHNLSFIIHSTGFYNASQRTNLQGNEVGSTENKGINEALLKVITERIKQKLLVYYRDTAKDEKFHYRFLNIYSNLLLSNKASENHKNWVDSCFIEPIFDILKLQVPTQNGYSNNAKNVKIKNTFLDINPSDFGCPEIEWFYWYRKADENLIEEALNSEKLGLYKWDIIDLIKYVISQGKVENINNWLKSANEAYFTDNKNFTYINFIKEIEREIIESDLPVISQVKLFKFSDNNYYSLNEIFENPNLVLVSEKVADIRAELRFLGLTVSNLDISKNPNIAKLITEKLDEEALFKAIAEKCKTNTLWNEQKQKLFFALANFDRIGAEKLKDLEMFKNARGQIRPLRNLLKGTLQVPNWLVSFKIHNAEYITELDKYLVSDKDIYQSIIFKNWDTIIEQKPNAKIFYEEVTFYYQQNKEENQRLEKFACIYTNEGFKKPEQVFFNLQLNSRNFYDLQNAIFKVTQKSTPEKFIFNFLIDDNSPFKVSKNESISSFINGTISFSYSEMSALLEFAKHNNEELFKFAYIQKQNNDFLLVKHSQNTFQYYSNRNEINELLAKNSVFRLLPKEFNPNDLRNLGIWQDKGLYLKVLQTLDFSENLLPIIRLAFI